MKLSLSMMCGNETKELEACLASVDKYVQEKVVAWTGDNPKTLAILNKYNVKVINCNPKTHPDLFFQEKDRESLTLAKEWLEIGRIKNFMGVRNVSLENVTNELVLWLDSDDTFENADKIPELIKYFDDPKYGALWFYYDYSKDKHGQTELAVWRERIFRKEWFKWVGYVHEEALKQTDCVHKAIDKEHVYIDHHSHMERMKSSGFRNLLISEYWYNVEKKQEKLDALNAWNYAKSLNAVELYKESMTVYEEFSKITQTDDHRYDAYLRLSGLGRKLKMYDYALDSGVQAMKLRPRWPWAYFSLAESSFVLEKWEDTIHYSRLGYNCIEKYGDPSETMPMAFDPTSVTWKPLQPLVYAYTQIADWEKALHYAREALQYVPKDKFFNTFAENIPGEIERESIENACLQIHHHLENKEKGKLESFSKSIPQIAETLPPFIRLKNKYKEPEEWQNKIVIYCGGGYELWDPRSTKTGIGGSEEAVINISKYLAKLGWTVEVYNNCLDTGNYDGVVWRNYYEYDKNQKCKIFIAWRDSAHLNLAPEESYKVTWYHDVWESIYSSKQEIEIMDKCFVLSNWHKGCFGKHIPNEKFYITRNGILPAQFSDKIKRDPLACIYASSPDRGLDTLLKQWPEILKSVPEARLHVFYGFTKNYDEVHKNDQRMLLFKEQIMTQLDKYKDTITYHGRVGHEELAKWFLSCGLWLYPTNFTEISCITGMKAQAAGTIPVTDTVAALDETVQYGVKIKGAMEKPEKIKKWTGRVIDYLKHPAKQEKIRPDMIKWAKKFFDWKNVAKEWSDLFKNVPRRTSKPQIKTKITFGCYNQKFPDWYNTDKDIVDITEQLPFKDNSAEMIYHSHVLEHISLSNAEKFLLECKRILKPGGIMRIAIPDFKKLLDLYSKGKIKTISQPDEFKDFPDSLYLSCVLFGSSGLNKEYEGHWMMYDEETLCYLLKSCDFTNMKKSKHDDPESKVIQAGAYDRYADHTLHYEVIK